MSFPYYTQLDAMVCGSICLKIIVQLYGKGYLLQTLREVCHITRERVLLMGSNDAAESVGLRSDGVKLIRQQLREEANFPCIVHLNQRHFVVMMLIVQMALVLSQMANNHIRSMHMLYMTMCIEQYSLSYCRRICGTVMQEGYIFIFFKEATNSLDTNNKRTIIEHLNRPQCRQVIVLDRECIVK